MVEKCQLTRFCAKKYSCKRVLLPTELLELEQLLYSPASLSTVSCLPLSRLSRCWQYCIPALQRVPVVMCLSTRLRACARFSSNLFMSASVNALSTGANTVRILVPVNTYDVDQSLNNIDYAIELDKRSSVDYSTEIGIITKRYKFKKKLCKKMVSWLDCGCSKLQ